MANLFDRFPPPGQQIRVNHHRMHIQHLGDHGPAVLFESGQAGFSLDWMRVQPEVSRFAQTWSYDRAGLGWSEAGPFPRNPQQVVAEFHALVEAEAIPKPFVIVAHSLGVRYTILYTCQYSSNVAGLVLVDGYYEAFDRGLGQERLKRFLGGRATQYHMMDTLARLGLPKIFGSQMIELLGPDFRNMPQQERKRYALMATRPNAMATAIDEQAQAVAALASNLPNVLPHGIPLRILIHGIPWPSPEDERLWQETQRQAATWSTHSKVIFGEKSGHNIMLSQPDLIIDAIRDVIGVAGIAS